MPAAWWLSTGHAAKIPGVTIALHRHLTDRHLLSHTHTRSNLETTTRAEKTGQVLTFLEPSKMSTCCSARHQLSAYHLWWESRHSDGHIYPVVLTSHWLDGVHIKSKDHLINWMEEKLEQIHLPEQGGNVCFKHTFFFFFLLAAITDLSSIRKSPHSLAAHTVWLICLSSPGWQRWLNLFVAALTQQVFWWQLRGCSCHFYRPD